MEPTNLQLLATIDRTLSHDVAPHSADKSATRAIKLVRLALSELMARERLGRDGLEAIEKRLIDFISRSEALRPAASAKSSSWPQRNADRLPQDALASCIEAAWERLANLMPALLANPSPADRNAINTLITDLAGFEAETRTLPPVVDAPDTEDETTTVARVQGLTDYFRKKLDAPALEIVEASTLSGGFSNQTVRVLFDNAPQEHQSIVLRISRAEGLLWPYVVSLSEELPMLQMAAAGGLPIASPLWHEPDRSLVGGEFLVTDFVGGAMLGDSLKAGAAIADAVIEAYANVVAGLHALPWQDWVGRLSANTAPRADLTTTDSIGLILDGLRRYLADAQISPSPIISFLFQWLESNCPQDDRPPALTHGDLAFHNWLFVGNTPTALLDWETAVLCSPMKDLSVIKDVAIPPAQWSLFLDCYVRAGGRLPTDAELHYFGVLRQLHALIVTSISTQKMFAYVDPLNIEYLELGIVHRRHFYEAFVGDLQGLLRE